jgi:hypothetical protein
MSNNNESAFKMFKGFPLNLIKYKTINQGKPFMKRIDRVL